MCGPNQAGRIEGVDGMISRDVYQFHDRPRDDWTWTETTFLFFSVPEEGISASVYVLARPNLGVCHATVDIHKGFCMNLWEIDFIDRQMHLPCPKDFANFTLPNGLGFEVTDAPRDFRFTYRSQDGICAFDVQFTAMSPPFDPHDPAENTLVATDVRSAKVPGYEGWHNGHMEVAGRIQGVLELHGKKYRVDCIDGVDNSWGPRLDYGQQGASWLHVTAGEDFSAFLAVALSFDSKELVYGPLRFGYVAENGRNTAIVEAEMKSQRRDMHSLRTWVRFKDAANRVYEALGTPLAAAPFHFNPSVVSYQTLMQWELGGKTGVSHLTDFLGLNFMSQGMSDKHSA
jgi:hypothetical protein